MIPHLGMHGIGIIHRGGPAGQHHQITSGAETKHLILKHGNFGVFQKLLGGGGIFHDLQQFPQPAVIVLFLRLLFINPVRGNAQLGHFVHGCAADLDFHTHIFRANDRGMQRPIPVKFRHTDIVFKPARNDLIFAVNHPQRGIAVGRAVHNQPKRHQIR